MKIAVGCIGRLKAGPERDLFDRYWDRLGASGRKVALAPLSLHEFAESRAGSADSRRSDEAHRLIGSLSAGYVIALDETGRHLDSVAFAALIRQQRDAGCAAMTFLLGGADGHGPEVRARANVMLSLGAMTLPHGLARVVLAEQLYRAATILSGHPYHRA